MAICRSGTITTGVGPIEVQQPRGLRPRRAADEAEPFSSKILPPYLRKTKSLEELIPWLYLKGVSTGDFNEALAALVGPNCPGLSASTVTRLKTCWEDEFQEWNKLILGRKAVRLLVGRRRAFQHPPGRRSAVHPGLDGRHGRRPQGVDRGGRWLSRERTIVEGAALGCEVARLRAASIRSWRRAMEPSVSGRHFGRSTRRLASNAAGSTRRPTCSTTCPSGCSPRPRRKFTTSGWLRRQLTPALLSTYSWPPTRPSTPR